MHYCRCYYCTPPSISSHSCCHVLATLTMPSLASLKAIILVIVLLHRRPFPREQNAVVSRKRTSRAMLESASPPRPSALHWHCPKKVEVEPFSLVLSLLPADLTPANPPSPPSPRPTIASYCNAHAMQCTHLTHGCAASYGGRRLRLPCRAYSPTAQRKAVCLVMPNRELTSTMEGLFGQPLALIDSV